MLTKAGHLSYCTNIHAGESWDDHFRALQQNFPAIKEAISPEAPMGIGLRLSNQASLQILEGNKIEEFKSWLQQTGSYVFTMNGFPYGGFHHTKVKDQVHAPDWTTTERVDYTKRLFTILAQLLPDGIDGGISTSPLSYRYWYKDADTLNQAIELATINLLDVVQLLISIRNQTGKILHLDIEPEPDGLLETGNEFISWFEQYLLPIGVPIINNAFQIDAAAAEKLIKDHCNLCYDICHFAIGFEDHATVMDQLAAKGLKIGKFQISAALKASLIGDSDKRTAIQSAFAQYNEPVYLHQVVARLEEGGLLRYPDLSDALQDFEHKGVQEWRAHFHVPVFEANFGLLESSRTDIETVLALHRLKHRTHHLEVETYTWEVLSPEVKLPIGQSIIRELQWVLDQLTIHHS